MIQKQLLEYYDWSNIQDFLCEQLGVTVQQFRNYHKVIGGEYKDFWHIWLEIAGEIQNDSYIKCCLDDYADILTDELTDQYGSWVQELIKPLDKLVEQLGYNVTVAYSW